MRKKFYLYDLQKERRICEVNSALFLVFGNAIFNLIMLKTMIGFIMEYSDPELVKNDKIIKSLYGLRDFLHEIRYDFKTTYTIIEIIEKKKG